MSKEHLEELLALIKPINKEKEAKLTTSDIEREVQLTDLELRREELEGNKQDRIQRKEFATRIFWLLAVFIAIVLVIIILVGSCVLELDKTVQITLLSTMSANVIGIFIYVVKYLFKSNICPKCGLKITQNQTIES